MEAVLSTTSIEMHFFRAVGGSFCMAFTVAMPEGVAALPNPKRFAVRFIVTAFMTSGATGYDSKVWEQVKYYYPVDAWLPKNMVIVSQKAFDKLDKPTQEAVLKAAATAETRGWKISAEKTVWYNEQLAKNGMKVEAGSEQLRSDFKKVGLTMIADWTTQTGAEGQAIIDAFRK